VRSIDYYVVLCCGCEANEEGYVDSVYDSEKKADERIDELEEQFEKEVESEEREEKNSHQITKQKVSFKYPTKAQNVVILGYWDGVAGDFGFLVEIVPDNLPENEVLMIKYNFLLKMKEEDEKIIPSSEKSSSEESSTEESLSEQELAEDSSSEEDTGKKRPSKKQLTKEDLSGEESNKTKTGSAKRRAVTLATRSSQQSQKKKKIVMPTERDVEKLTEKLRELYGLFFFAEQATIKS